jgi:hypothetical protein
MAGSAPCRKLDRLANRDRLRRQHGGRGSAQGERGLAVEAGLERHRGRRGRRRRYEGQPLPKGLRALLNLADIERRNLAVRDEHGGSDAIVHHGRDDPAIGEKIIIALAEDPMRAADFGLDRGERQDCALAQRIKVPPAGAVRAEMQSAIRGKARLHDGFLGFARE